MNELWPQGNHKEELLFHEELAHTYISIYVCSRKALKQVLERSHSNALMDMVRSKVLSPRAAFFFFCSDDIVGGERESESTLSSSSSSSFSTPTLISLSFFSFALSLVQSLLLKLSFKFGVVVLLLLFISIVARSCNYRQLNNPFIIQC